MSLNVMNEYIDFKKKAIHQYASLCLDKYYHKKIFDVLLDCYVHIRYYNINDDLNDKKGRDKIAFLINKSLVKEAKKLVIEDNQAKVEAMLNFFGFVYQLDGVLEVKDYESVILDINHYRIHKLSLDRMDDKRLLKMLSDDDKSIQLFLSEFVDHNFYLDIKKIQNKKCFDVCLKHNVSIPKLYSKYAIDKVFNNGLILENKLFAMYYMICIQVIEDVYYFCYDHCYLVEIAGSLFEKSDKLARLLHIIDNDIVKEKVVIKIGYSDYIQYKDMIFDFIQKGYQFCLVIDDKDIDEGEVMLFDLFRFVMVKNENKVKYKGVKNLIMC